MKQVIIFSSILLLFIPIAQSQNVGIGNSNPEQKLDVSGAIKIGSTSDNIKGTIRYDINGFEGGNGSTWSLFGVPVSGIVLSETQNNAPLENAGYQIIGKTQMTFAGFGASGAWVPIPMINIPSVNAIANATGVLTGNKYIIWGGYYNGDFTAASGYKNLGYMFDSSTNTWTNTSTTGAPAGRHRHFAGKLPSNRMLIFGGYSKNTGGGNVPYNDGAIFNPATNTWGALFSTVNAPFAFSLVSGKYALDTIANKLYTYSYYIGVPYLNVYNISTNTWSALSTTNAPTGAALGGNVWMGSPVNKWMFWGGDPASGTFEGKLYYPATNTWTTMTTPPAFVQSVNSPSLVWTGSDVIVYGGALNGVDNYSNQALKYNPTSNTWTELATLNKPSPRFSYSIKYGGDKLFIWGGFEKQLDNSYIQVGSGAFYNLTDNTWNEIPATSGAPDSRAGSLIEWTGQELYIWGGSSLSGRTGALSGGRYSPDLSTGGGFGGYQNKVYYLYQKL